MRGQQYEYEASFNFGQYGKWNNYTYDNSSLFYKVGYKAFEFSFGMNRVSKNSTFINSIDLKYSFTTDGYHYLVIPFKTGLVLGGEKVEFVPNIGVYNTTPLTNRINELGLYWEGTKRYFILGLLFSSELRLRLKNRSSLSLELEYRRDLTSSYTERQGSSGGCCFPQKVRTKMTNIGINYVFNF